MSTVVALPINIYAEETRADPFPAYADIRDAGPVVLLDGDTTALGRSPTSGTRSATGRPSPPQCPVLRRGRCCSTTLRSTTR